MKSPFVDGSKISKVMALKCLCGEEVFFYMVGPGRFHYDCPNDECRAVATVELHGRRKLEAETPPLRLVR